MSGMVLNQYILWKVKGKEPCVMKLTPANERRSRITTFSMKYGSGSKTGAFSWVIPKPSPKTTSNKKPTPSPNPTNNSESTTLSSSRKETPAFCPPSDAIFHKTLKSYHINAQHPQPSSAFTTLLFQWVDCPKLCIYPFPPGFMSQYFFSLCWQR